MKILALDASTEALSAAVIDGAREFEHFEIAPRAHASRLLPAIQRLLAQADLTLDALDGIAFARGPGAFTGLRVAAGLVQGLAAAFGADRSLPVAPVSTLAAVAARCMRDPAAVFVRVVQDARMGEIYTADFDRDADGRPVPVGAERVIRPETLEPDIDTPGGMRAGNGWPVVAHAHGIDPASLQAVQTWPHALDVARLGSVILAAGAGVDAAQALPVYVRDEVARKPGGR